MFYIRRSESGDFIAFVNGVLREYKYECDVPKVFHTLDEAKQNMRDFYVSIGYDADILKDKRAWFFDISYVKPKHYTEYL